MFADVGLHQNVASVDFSNCRAVWLGIPSKANVLFESCLPEQLSRF